jgi:hypothetical protein
MIAFLDLEYYVTFNTSAGCKLARIKFIAAIFKKHKRFVGDVSSARLSVEVKNVIVNFVVSRVVKAYVDNYIFVASFRDIDIGTLVGLGTNQSGLHSVKGDCSTYLGGPGCRNYWMNWNSC